MQRIKGIASCDAHRPYRRFRELFCASTVGRCFSGIRQLPRVRPCLAAAAIAGLLCMSGASAHAQATYQWDPNGSAAGLGGAGTWNTVSTFWDLVGDGLDDGTDATVAYTFVLGDTAIFGGTAGTVFMGLNPNDADLVFQTGGYRFDFGPNAGRAYNGDITIATTGNTTFYSRNNTGQTFNGDINLNGGTLVSSGGNNTTHFVGSITGNGTYQYLNGTRVILNDNNYSGTTLLEGPRTDVRHANAFGTSTVEFNGGGINADVAGVTLANNAMNWNNDFTFLGSESLNLGAGAVTLGAGVTVTTTANSLTVGGVIDDGVNSYGLSKAGAGTLALNGANLYAGNTTVNEGTLALGASGSIANSPNVTVVSGALLDISAGGMTLGVAQTLVAGRTSGFATDITGNLTLGGTLKPADDGTIGTLTVAGDLDLAGGTLNLDVATGSLSDSIDLGGVGAVTASAATTINVSAAEAGIYTIISGSTTTTIPTANLSVTGNGALAATFDNSTAGTLKLSLATAGAATLTWNGTAAPGNVWNTDSGSQNWLDGGTPAAFADGDTTVFDGSAAENTVDIATIVSPLAVTVSGANDVTFGGSGAIAGTIALTKDGAGNLTINNANTYSGGTTINEGTLTLGNPTDSLADTGDILVKGGTLALGANSDTVGAVTLASGSITGSGGMLSGSSYAVESGTISAALGGAGTLTKSTAATVTLSGAGSTYGGGTVIDDGTLVLGTDDALADAGALTVNGGATFDIGDYSDAVGAVTLTDGSITGGAGTLTGASYAFESGNVSARLGGSGTLSKTTGGTLTLSGDNSAFSGTTTLSAGTLLVGHDSALGTGLTIISGGNIAPSGGARTLANAVRIDVNAGLNGGTLNFAGTVTLNASLSMSGNADYHTFSGAVTGGGGLTRTTGSGSLTLSGPNDFSGGVTWGSGTAGLTLASDTALGTGTFTVQGGGWIYTGASPVANANDNAIALNANLTFGGPQSLDLGAGAVTMNATRTVTVTTSRLTLGGPVGESGAGFGLNKTGNGTLVLGGANTYTGPTAIDAGMLLINGSHSVLGAGDYTVAGGATLGGSGLIGSVVNVSANATLAPGGTDTTAILTVNNDATLFTSSVLHLNLNGGSAGTEYDRLVVTGSFVCAGATLDVHVPPAYHARGGTVYEIVHCDSTIVGNFAGLPDKATFLLPGTDTTVVIRYRNDITPRKITLTVPAGGTVFLVR